ncbi:lipase [Bacterioplanes sanyensis]|uniref:alpha/beta fold hydrolase n=1 Tax=Bacterioplanes sanyensis TaxID=1249553 RepID=UPI0016728D4E|nr:alpha/beta hydrolase [Bacterioplanes sanyensis]GGY36272.1 lipase [Bacterioplanes sanyensis]
MKKVVALFSLLTLAALLGVVQGAYLPTGQWLYENATDWEASLYGFQQQQVDIGDMQLALYRNHNPGKPVIVMLHGYSADKDVWPRFARHLTDEYQVLIPDMAGHGDTGFRMEWDYGMVAQAQRLSQLLTELEIDQAHIIGNSMGGYLTAVFSVYYPQQTLSATMVDPAGLASPQASDLEKMLAQGRNPFLMNSRTEFDEFYAMTMAQPPFLPDMVLEAVAHDYINRREELAKIFADFNRDIGLQQKLPRLQAPAMLWWGAEDRLLHVSAVESWQQALPDMQVHIWQDIGHMPMVEVPRQAAKRYQAFLSSID